MNNESTLKIANILRNIARYTLLVIGGLVFVFALFSGAEEYGGGFQGVIKNSPNALPWAGLLLLVFVAWEWELVGGIIITALGFFMLAFFNTGQNFFLFTFVLCLLIVALGLLFIISWFLRRRG